jgi:hypothetical protein
MASLPVEILYGLYLGALTGFVPALIAWALGLGFRYFTGITMPGLAVVGLGVAIAGLNGGLLALTDPSLTASENQARLTVAILVVLMVTLYAHNQGDKLGADLPRKVSLRSLTARTLSTDVVELVGGRGQVRVTVVGGVGDIEGYPPLPADLRERIEASEWTFPADVPLVELESRVSDRLRTEFDLAAVSVTLDERARAAVSAAPPMSGLSKRLSSGQRAVSLTALVPTGTAHGDEVSVLADGESFDATVLSVATGPTETAASTAASDEEASATDGGEDAAPALPPVTDAPTAVGGECRVTLAADRQTAIRLLSADTPRLVVRSRGVRREFELVSLLRRAGKRFRRLTVAEGSALDGVTIGDAAVRDEHGVAVLAVRHAGTWLVAPRGDQAVVAGDDLVAVGSVADLDAFAEVVA